jgi:hypothetical protein
MSGEAHRQILLKKVATWKGPLGPSFPQRDQNSHCVSAYKSRTSHPQVSLFSKCLLNRSYYDIYSIKKCSKTFIHSQLSFLNETLIYLQ